ncbi:hypothetical protein B0H13DRAFT_2345193 [Mycena leptocephala]|nr:hypothetical protein B0H13DRAFT_2345193 [Mycena leptocephala]
MTISLHTMPATDPIARPPRLRRRRMSAPPLRAAPPRLPPCRPLPLSLEALDLSPASPAQALASLRFLVLSYLADLERRLSLFESAEWASTALDMLRSIRADVHSHLPDLPSLDLSPALSLDFDLLDFDYFEFPEFKEKLKSRLSNVKGLVSSSLDFDFSSPLSYVPTLSARLRSLHAHLAAELPCFEFEFALARPTFEFRRPSFDFDFSAPPLLRELLDAFRADVDAFLAELPSLPSLPASISLPRPHLPASLSAVSLLDHAHAEGEGEEEESGPTPADALRRADFGRKLIGYEDLPLEWRNNPWVVSGYRNADANAGVSYHIVLGDTVASPSGLRAPPRTHTAALLRIPTEPCGVFIPLTRWPALVRSVFTLHNESLNIHTHFVPMVLWGAAFWGVGVPLFLKPLAPWLEVPDAWARKWVGEEWARPQPPPPDAAESLFTLFALACLACSALWHTMAGCAHRGAMEACARVDYVGIGWLIATSIATVVHHGYACAEQAVDATPLGHTILHPSMLLHSGAVEVLQGKAADVVQALMHPSTLLHGAEKVAVEGGKWVDGVEGGSVLADTLASFTAPLCALLVSLSSLSSVAPLRPLFNVAASFFAPVLDFASALNASLAHMVSATSSAMSATSNATSSLAAWPAYHPVGAGCLLLCAAAGVSGNVLPFCDWFNRVENRLWRLAFFVGISFSALAPLAGIAALQAPVGPSLLYYIVGLVVYATQVPERFLGGRGGSHGIWHIFIVLAMRAHRDGIREMRRAAAEGGCAIRAGPGA